MRRNRPEPAAARVIAALLSAVAGCASLPACRDGEQAVVIETLYFGTATPDGVVAAADWRDFLARELTPRFPQGLTVTEADGQWRGADGRIVHEATHVLTLIGTDADDAAIRALAGAYRTRFRQEAVLRVRQPACRVD